MLIRGVACDRCKDIIVVKGHDDLLPVYRVTLSCATHDKKPVKKVLCEGCAAEVEVFLMGKKPTA